MSRQAFDNWFPVIFILFFLLVSLMTIVIVAKDYVFNTTRKNTGSYGLIGALLINPTKKYHRIIFGLFILSLAFLVYNLVIVGLPESDFTLSKESRLPKWYTIPSGMNRSDVNVTMDYYIAPRSKADFKLFVKDNFFSTKKVGSFRKDRGEGPWELKNPPPGSSKGYPAYEIITVDGITDIVEHRKMEPIFYMTDDPAVWKELDVKQ